MDCLRPRPLMRACQVLPTRNLLWRSGNVHIPWQPSAPWTNGHWNDMQKLDPATPKQRGFLLFRLLHFIRFQPCDNGHPFSMEQAANLRHLRLCGSSNWALEVFFSNFSWDSWQSLLVSMIVDSESSSIFSICRPGSDHISALINMGKKFTTSGWPKSSVFQYSFSFRLLEVLVEYMLVPNYLPHRPRGSGQLALITNTRNPWPMHVDTNMGTVALVGNVLAVKPWVPRALEYPKAISFPWPFHPVALLQFLANTTSYSH